MVSDLIYVKISLSAFVLILVLMEYGLWHSDEESMFLYRLVLILVLMEYGLWQAAHLDDEEAAASLNPCSNGIWSLTEAPEPKKAAAETVLILVLMEYGLWR